MLSTSTPSPSDTASALAAARALLAAVDYDNNGKVVAGIRTGGNGGLISPDTSRAADTLRLALDRLEARA